MSYVLFLAVGYVPYNAMQSLRTPSSIPTLRRVSLPTVHPVPPQRSLPRSTGMPTSGGVGEQKVSNSQMLRDLQDDLMNFINLQILIY